MTLATLTTIARKMTAVHCDHQWTIADSRECTEALRGFGADMRETATGGNVRVEAHMIIEGVHVCSWYERAVGA